MDSLTTDVQNPPVQSGLYCSELGGVSGSSWLGPDICMKSSLSSVMSSSRDGRGGAECCSRSSMKSHRRTLFMN